MKRCCFAGHRPKSLPWGYDEKGDDFGRFKNKLRDAIEQSVKEGYTHFMSGMALGIDMLAGEIVLELKKQYPEINLECAIPCKNQSHFWKKESIERYEKILQQADDIIYVCEHSYFSGCMTIRNNYMLSNSSRLIAVYNGEAGGTKTTIEKAIKDGLDVVLIRL